jgi:L-asparaginase II
VKKIVKYVDLVSSTRGNIVENIHQGIAVAMDSEGRVIKKWGDITTEIFPRSALKLIQTFGIITTGADKALKLSDERIAFATSSHHAETVHLEMVKSWLSELGLEEEDLTVRTCLATWSRKEKIILSDTKGEKVEFIIIVLENIADNYLFVSKHSKFKTLNYHDPKHPVQKLFIENLEKLAES